MSEQAYPLQWPEGWPRTPDWKQSRGEKFGRTEIGNRGFREKKSASFAASRDRLTNELRRLGARHVVISTNHKPDRHGVPVEAKRKPNDDGVALYFLFNEKQMAMACDRYTTAAANMTSLALAIEAMRQLERHGGGVMMERAFEGFIALPPAGDHKRHWREVLAPGIGTPLSTRDDVMALYRMRAKGAHPDAGGSDQAMAELNNARDEALRELGLQ